MSKKRVIVIGGGLGGISAAISLAQQGYAVTIFEKNEKLGGKLNVMKADGFTFDLGPSILTLPHVFERLFERSGKKMADYVSIRPVRPHWRNFFEDGQQIDLFPEPEKMAAEATKAGEDPENVRRFLDYSNRLYDLVDRGYFEKGLDTARDFRAFYGLKNFFTFDLFRSMHGGVKRYLKTPHFRDIFDYFIKYVGSSAYRAPAFMNCLPTIQFKFDLWYVDGGMYNLAIALHKLIDELGIAVHCNCEVAKMLRDGNRIDGVKLRDGTNHSAEIVVSNMEVIPAYRELLAEDQSLLQSLEKKYEPACSGLVIDIGLDRQYAQLAHHNFFFSKDQKKHFADVFVRHQLPDDPTIYLVAAAKTDPTVAPSGCDGLKILPHVPHLDDEHALTAADYEAFKQRVYSKLERMGLTNLRKHIVFEHVWTPLDIQREYFSNRGSIYGVVSDRFRNLAFKAPKQSEKYPNLFFVGGSVNPGGGMPMVALCGQKVCEKIVAWDRA